MTNGVICISLCLLSMAITTAGYHVQFDPITAGYALYAVNNKVMGPTTGLSADERAPRTYLHSVYKFGHCTPDTIQRVFLRRTSNLTLTDWQATQANYIYLLEMENSQRFRLQCVVMKMFVPKKYLFFKGRIPLYYCQGTVRYVYLLTYQKIEIHEWYLHRNLNMPATIQFEFYHAPPISQHVHHYY